MSIHTIHADLSERFTRGQIISVYAMAVSAVLLWAAGLQALASVLPTVQVP